MFAFANGHRTFAPQHLISETAKPSASTTVASPPPFVHQPQTAPSADENNQNDQHSSTMAYPMKALEPGNLYLTMSIAHQPPGYEPVVEADARAYLDSKVDSGQANSGDHARNIKEQFIWGLYYHRALRDGTTYTLRRIDPNAALKAVSKATLDAKSAPDATPATAATALNATPTFKLRRRTVRESPRLDFAVVGLVRMLASPADPTVDLTPYLDRFALLEAALAQQTFSFAATVASRARRHVLELQHPPTAARLELPLPPLLAECLAFAHAHVWFALGRQLPRPILSSTWACAPLPVDQRAAAAAAAAGKGRGKGPLGGDDKPAAGGRRNNNTRPRKTRGVQNPRGAR